MEKKQILTIVGVVVLVIIAVVAILQINRYMQDKENEEYLKQLETNTDTKVNTNSEESNYLTANILGAENCQLDKGTFGSPDNSAKFDSFYVKLVKRGNVEIGFSTTSSEEYDNYEELSKTSTTVNKKTIGGFEGYLDENAYGFIFVFKKDGEYYSVANIDADIKWNSGIEEDIGILLKEWASKS